METASTYACLLETEDWSTLGYREGDSTKGKVNVLLAGMPAECISGHSTSAKTNDVMVILVTEGPSVVSNGTLSVTCKSTIHD